MNLSHNSGLMALMARLGFFLRHGFRDLVRMRTLRFLLPFVTVRVDFPDGVKLAVCLPSGEVQGSVPDAPDALACVLPDRICLFRRIQLPFGITARDEASAVMLEVETASPFSQDDTVHGWSSVVDQQGRLLIDIVISSRILLQREIEGRGHDIDAVEVWAMPSGSSVPAEAIILRGFGERLRAARMRRRIGVFLLQVLLIIGLMAALLAVPLWDKRQAVIAAQAHHATLSDEIRPIMEVRDQLERLRASHQEIVPAFLEEPDLLAALERISTVMPDGAWLGQLEYTNGVVRIVGTSDDAALLLQRLQRETGFNNVRSTSSIVRDPRTRKETFIFEMEAGS